MEKNFEIPTPVKRLGEVFETEGFEIRIVGGWVRDTLQGVSPKDLDLATDATPEQVIALCKKHGIYHFETGLQHGTLTLVPPSEQTGKKSGLAPEIANAYEVTTLRIDRETDGRHAEVEWTTSWEADAARRDFTINAMAVRMDGRLFDYFDGAQHLKDRRVIFVGDAETRIREDYLRIMRWFRFRSRIGDRTQDAVSMAVIRKTADGLRQISVERIWSEFSRILSGDPTMLATCLMDMWATKVFVHLDLPDINNYDVVRALLAREVTDNPITVLATLTVATLEQDWNMSTDEARQLRLCRKHWNELHGLPTLYPDLAYYKDLALKRGVGFERAREVCRMFGPSDTLRKFEAWTPPDFPVTGTDLAALGIPEGVQCGKILKGLREQWRDSDYSLGRSDLLASVQPTGF